MSFENNLFTHLGGLFVAVISNSATESMCNLLEHLCSDVLVTYKIIFLRYETHQQIIIISWSWTPLSQKQEQDAFSSLLLSVGLL